EKALEYDQIRDGRSTALFFVAIAPDGSAAGGLRAQGPYREADEAHAIVEWDGQPGAVAVRSMITDRIPFGVVEMKGAWVADSAARRPDLTRSLAGFGCCTMEILDVQFLLATAAEHVLALWASSGGEVAQHIPPAAYPDDRYRTRMMWWDRRNRQNLGVAKKANQFIRMRAPSPIDDDDGSVRLHRSN
ncbi:hypothetical protein, partial [Rhodococcus sp. NPDC058514]